MLSIVKNCLTCCGAVHQQFIQLKGCGKTIRNRNQYASQNNNNNTIIYSITYWKDISINLNLVDNTFDGVGISQIGRKHFHFILLGNIIEFNSGENGLIKIEITKHHYNLNILHYIGYYNVYTKKMQLISEDNTIIGELQFN